ncbi:MAG: hypothetical protein H6587_03465 [Flavobacteriales bacterium]|nr:hypothetical protein [Flavobacteriales bacterium]MCB9363607.1 hypothetical protein [Flavobacteriales bacterium]
MALIPLSEIREVYGITPEENREIFVFLQGAVYCWCKNRPDEWFSMRDLMGGENFDWTGTPLSKLYDKHIQTKSDMAAIEDAGKDSGWILKKVVTKDIRTFETKKEDLIRKYRWIKSNG